MSRLRTALCANSRYGKSRETSERTTMATPPARHAQVQALALSRSDRAHKYPRGHREDGEPTERLAILKLIEPEGGGRARQGVRPALWRFAPSWRFPAPRNATRTHARADPEITRTQDASIDTSSRCSRRAPSPRRPRMMLSSLTAVIERPSTRRLRTTNSPTASNANMAKMVGRTIDFNPHLNSSQRVSETKPDRSSARFKAAELRAPSAVTTLAATVATSTIVSSCFAMARAVHRSPNTAASALRSASALA